MDFEFIHSETGEKRTIVLLDKEIQELLEDDLYDKINECDCEPIGETNVIECNCDDYTADFVLQER